MTSNELEIFKQSILDDVRVMMQTTGQVTQYIGARYVPLFAEPLDWSAEREYEPLTIVLDHGNSFTSRQFVPKGVDISETSFWANTGNYNAQIEQYRKEVEQYRKEVENVKDSITTLEEIINNLPNTTTPEEHGAVGDGSTDDTAAFTAALATGKPVVLDKTKSYKLNNLAIAVDDSVILGMGSKVIGTDGADSVLTINNTWRTVVRDLKIECSGAKCGMKIAANMSLVDNVFINNAVDFGLSIVAGDGVKTSGYENVIRKITVHALGDSCTGINCARADNFIEDIVTRDCMVGIKFSNGFCHVSNFHPWVSKTSMIANSIGILISTENQIQLDNVYMDTIGTAIKIEKYIPQSSNFAVVVNGMYLYYNDLFDSTDVEYAVIDCVGYHTTAINLNNVTYQKNTAKNVKMFRTEPTVNFANINFAQQQSKIPNEMVKYSLSECQFEIGEGIDNYNALTTPRIWYDGKVMHFSGAFKTTKQFNAYGLVLGKLYRRDFKFNNNFDFPCVMQTSNNTIIATARYEVSSSRIIIQNVEQIQPDTKIFIWFDL